MKILSVGADLFHAGGRTDGQTDRHDEANRMFIGQCIIVIVAELKTNLMSLVIFISLIICSTCFGH